MINLDAEEADILTVSCAGEATSGFSFRLIKLLYTAQKISLEILGLKGGHSGVDIDKGRINANILAGRILHYAKKTAFHIVNINGGTKGNAIPFAARQNLWRKMRKA